MAKVAESACGSYLTPSSASHPEEVQTQGSLPIIGAVTITRETGLWTSVGPSPLHKNPTPNHQRHTGHGRRLPVSRQTHSGVCTFLPQLRPDRSPRHQEQGRGRVRQRPLLARTARPDQPTLPAQRHDPGTGGRRDAPSRLSGHFPDRQDRGHPYPPLAVHAPEGRVTHCPATQKLRRHHRHRIGQVAFVLHTHHRPHPQGAGIGQYGAHPGHRHLPDECPGQQPA